MTYSKIACLSLAALLLTACGGGDDLGLKSEDFGTKAGASTYWAGTGRALPTTPLGNKVAISCHNCYGDNLAATQAKVAKALARDFDLVELDLTTHADGQVYVEHNDSELARGSLQASLANTALQQSNRMLFLEVKEGYRSAAQSDAMMLAVLRAIRDHNYATAARPAFLRAFMDGRHNHLVRAKQLLAASEFSGIRNYVRLHSLVDSDIRNNIRTSKNLGFHGVELEYSRPNLFGSIQQAKMPGLGVGALHHPGEHGRGLSVRLARGCGFSDHRLRPGRHRQSQQCA